MFLFGNVGAGFWVYQIAHDSHTIHHRAEYVDRGSNEMGRKGILVQFGHGADTPNCGADDP